MAIKKKVDPAVEEDVTTDKEAEEPKAPEAVADKPKPNKMVLVKNHARFDYVQPSTGITIRRQQAEPTKLLNDDWLDQFVAAGLLERV